MTKPTFKYVLTPEMTAKLILDKYDFESVYKVTNDIKRLNCAEKVEISIRLPNDDVVILFKN